MKTLLILATHPDVAEAVRTALDPAHYRVIHRLDAAQAEPFTERGMIDICLLDLDLTSVQSTWVLEKLRRRMPHCPIVVIAGARSQEWEEEAYLQGVTHVLTKPVRPRLLTTILDRLQPAPSAPPTPAPVAPMAPAPFAAEARIAPSPHTAGEALAVLRNFSGVLTHSLDAEALLREFLLRLRDILGVNRAAIFLRQPTGGFAGAPGESRVLKSACSVGLAPGLLEHFELSFETGIGGYLHRRGRILRAEGHEAGLDVAIRKEFELLGAQAAVPILDRESLVGVAVFDGRVTGEPLINGELELVFHLLEELGLAVKNIWLHGQLASNHEMMTGVLRELSSACVVIGRDLDILHANKAARQLFARGRRNTGAELEFSDLPQVLGGKVYQVLKTGAGIATFKHTPPEQPNATYSVTVMPFRRSGGSVPDAALLVVEDHTQAEQLRKLEIEAAGLRLIKSMADRIAHEVGNAMVPLSTHQQLLGERYKDAEFRASLDLAMSEGVKRVNRLINQMRFLARDAVLSRENMPLAVLLEEAFKEAHRHQPARSAKLQFENGGQPVVLAGDRAALRHAFSEVLLNAIQANPSDPKVRVTTSTDTDGQGLGWVHIDVLDTGGGFTPEAAQKVPTPFFTTRTVGLGLGLCVTRKVLETHLGRLSIFNTTPGQPNSVRLTLPMVLQPASALAMTER